MEFVQQQTDEDVIRHEVLSTFTVNQTKDEGVQSNDNTSSSGGKYECASEEGEKYVNSMYQIPVASKMTTNTSMTSTIPAPPMSNLCPSFDDDALRSSSSRNRSRQQKQSQAEVHRIWETEYVADHLMRGTQFEYFMYFPRPFITLISICAIWIDFSVTYTRVLLLIVGHMNYCFAWLDNGVCPQHMVSGKCCFLHDYPNSWTDEMIRCVFPSSVFAYIQFFFST